METNQQTVRSVFGKPAKTYELRGTLTVSVVLSIPSLTGGMARTKTVTLATWRGVKREHCEELVARFHHCNDEYSFKDGVVTAKWQAIEYI